MNKKIFIIIGAFGLLAWGLFGYFCKMNVAIFLVGMAIFMIMVGYGCYDRPQK